MKFIHLLAMTTAMAVILPVELQAETVLQTRPKPAVAAKPAEPSRTEEVTIPPASLPEADAETKAPPAVKLDVGNDLFRQALASSYETNPRIKSERQNLQAIDENVPQALSGFLPTVRAGYERGRQRTSFDNSEWNHGDTKTRTLTLSQPVFNGGETISQYQSANRLVKAGRAQLTGVEQGVILGAVTAYMDLVRDQSVLDLSMKNVSVLREQFKASSDRFEVGEVTRTDVAQSEARVAQAEADRIQSEGNLASTRAVYKRVIGQDPPAAAVQPSSLPPIPDALDEVMAIALEGNPDVVRARYRALSAESDVYTQIANLLPDVSINGSMSRDDGAGTTGTSEFDNDQITVNVSIPLYQSGAEWSRVRQSKATSRQRRFDETDTLDEIRQNVTRAWEQYQTAKAKIISNKSAVDAAQIALNGVKQEQLYGARTVLDVLDAERELFIARVDLVRSQRDEMVSAYSLLSVMGRLTPEYVDIGVETYDPKEHYHDVKFQFIGF